MFGIRLLPSERLAAVMLAALLAGAFLYDWLYRTLFIFGPLLVGFLWFLVLLFALFGVVFAFRDDATAKERVRNGASMPIAVVSAYLLSSPAFDVGRWVLGYAHLQWHRAEYDQQVLTGGGPTVFPYVQGVPDAGVSIIHSDRDPAALSAAAAIRLVGEPIGQCRELRDNFHLCTRG